MKYLVNDSSNVEFDLLETRSIVVENEALDIVTGYQGDAVVFTANVKDSQNEALPVSFIGSLIFGGLLVVDEQVFDAAVYDPITFLLTLPCGVPAVAPGIINIRLHTPEQVI